MNSLSALARLAVAVVDGIEVPMCIEIRIVRAFQRYWIPGGVVQSVIRQSPNQNE